MIYKQKKSGTELKFKFNEDNLEYFLKDSSGSFTKNIPYENISNETFEHFEKNVAHKNNAIYSLVIGIIFLMINFATGIRLAAGLFLIASLVFFILYKFGQNKYTVLKSREQDIFILQNKQHNLIKNKILNTRNEFIKKTYLNIDKKSNIGNEINKFKWLKHLKIISNEEFKNYKNKVEKTFEK